MLRIHACSWMPNLAYKNKVLRGKIMKKNEPKMILNLSIENDELEEKIKIAMEEYTEKLISKNLDDVIAKFIDKRLDRLLNGSRWTSDKQIRGVYFEDYIEQKAERAIADAIDKNIKKILEKKLASLI